MGALGAIVFAGTGLLTLLLGGRFLEYQFLPLPDMDTAALHSAGILFIEVGVGIAVMSVLVAIYDDIMEGAGGD